jgi:hypothetical protein
MGYTPAYDATSLSVHIGTVGGGTIASGSANLGPVWFAPLPGHAEAEFFSAEDIGRLVTVLGAGVDGAILIARIVSFTDAQNVVLDTAASTSVSDGPNTTVFRPCDVVRDALNYDSTLTARDTTNFTARSLDGSFIPVEGQPVLFVSEDPAVGDEYGVFFGGAIDSVTVQNYHGNARLDSECQCISWEHLATKRVMMGQKYLSANAGDIFTDIIEKGLAGDFVGAIAVAGPIVEALTIDDYSVVADALDRVAQAVSNAVDVYYWKMDPWRRAIFALQTTTPAPWSISTADGSDANILANLRITRTREKYSNHAYVEASQQLNPPKTHSAKIGTHPVAPPPGYASRAISLPGIPAVTPSMTIDGTPLVCRATGDDPRLGVATVPEGADWAWLVGTEYIWTDPAHAGLTVGPTIVVTYQTADVGRAFAEYAEGIAERSTVEGGTGYHETTVNIDHPISRDELIAFAESVAQRFGEIPTIVDVETYRSGLKVGQSITLDRPEVAGDFVISSAGMSVQDGMPKWSITATNGSVIGDWRTALMGAFGGGVGVAGGGGAGVRIGGSGSTSQGVSRTISESGSQLATDELVLCDTSGISTSTDTLGAAVDDTETAWTFGSGSAIVNGTYVQVGSEKVYVVSGSGASRVVTRGALGTTAASHANGATVTVPGALAFSLLAIEDVPNVSLIVRKVSADLNYVVINAATGDSFPGGSTSLILPDNTADRGTVYLRAPAPPSTEWIQLASAGAPGPAGPPGAAGVGTPAPNVTATCAVTFEPYGHLQQAIFGGTITLPTADPDYSHLKTVEVYGIDPSGDAHFIGRFDSWSGSTITYSAVIGMRPAATETWKARFIAFNEQGAPTDPPYEITGISVPAATITSLTATDDTANRWSDPALHAVVPVTIALSAYPFSVSLEFTSPQYGRVNHGAFTVSGPVTINIGARNTGSVIFPPTVNDETVTVRAAIGQYGQETALSGVTGVATTTVLVHKPTVYAATGSSTAGAPTLIDTGGAGGSKQWILTADFGLPLADPNFFFARVTRVIGKYVGGVWTPLPGQPTFEGVTGAPIGDWAGPTLFSSTVDHSPALGLVGAIQSSGLTAVRLTWGPHAYDNEWNVIRLYLYLGTRADDGSGGTKTQQSTWPSGTAYREITLDATKAQSDAREIDPTTLDPSLVMDPVTSKPKINTSNLANMAINGELSGGTTGWNLANGYWQSNVGIGGGGGVVWPNADTLSSTLGEQSPHACVPGREYFATAMFRTVGAATGSVLAQIWFVDAAGVTIGSPSWGTHAAAADWTAVSVSATAPAGACFVAIQVYIGGETTGGVFWVVDNVLLYAPDPVGQGLERTTAGGSQVPTGGISEALLGALAVSAAKIQDGAVQTAKIADLSVITSKLATGAVNATKLADLAVEAAKLADSSVTATKIANLAVGSAAIAALAVGTGHIANAAITNAKIGNLAVSTAQIQDAAITTAKITNLAVTTAHIQDGAITTVKIGDAQITSAKIASLDVSKLTAGTATFSADVTFSRGGGSPGVLISSTGVFVLNGSLFVGGHSFGATGILFAGTSTVGWNASATAVSATAGGATLPAAPAQFVTIFIGSTPYKIPLYNN